ncbi:hypothetical protein KSP39_PZI015782 [Platanthera zijinensis]|uniref:poly(A)-specific ribonuclease n=1 Tax=Platanthera zijinensis TaxID=2320716 RepID=A0AAP0G1M1_9ASPA
MSSAKKKEICIRRVWAYNLEPEFDLIRKHAKGFPFAAVDTEFPGVVYRPLCHHRLLYAHQRYAFIKANVDALQIIQVGISLSDEEGNLPDFGLPGAGFVWEFNFRDFDVFRHSCAVESIEMLRSHGVDFNKNREVGVDSRHFAELLASSGLIFNGSSVSWVGFHNVYDFGYLIKILTRRRLPATLAGFLGLVSQIFGDKVFDVKHMIRYCDGVFGGLERVAETLKVKRLAGVSHQAGSDSLLTLQTFLKLKRGVFEKKGIDKYAGVFHGLEFLQPSAFSI